MKQNKSAAGTGSTAMTTGLTNEGVQLGKGFLAIKDSKARHKTVDLITARGRE